MTIIPRLERVRGDGLWLHYREWSRPASGETVVLLHGLTGAAEDWDGIAKRLSNRARVVALEARGHGASDWSADAAYAADAHFADVVCALDDLEIHRCTVVGFSMGGGIAILTAAAAPERVSGLVVVDAYPSPEMTPGSARIAAWTARQDGGVAPSVHGLPRRFDPAIARAFAEQLREHSPRRLDLWPFWGALLCPTLLVRGESSDVLPERLAQEMLARQPRARLVTVPGIGHGIPHERPAELARAIAQFIHDESYEIGEQTTNVGHPER